MRTMTEATGFDGTEEERINMTDHIAMQLQELLGEENVRRKEPMSLHTSFREDLRICSSARAILPSCRRRSIFWRKTGFHGLFSEREPIFWSEIRDTAAASLP